MWVLKIATDVVTNATKTSSSATKIHQLGKFISEKKVNNKKRNKQFRLRNICDCFAMKKKGSSQINMFVYLLKMRILAFKF